MLIELKVLGISAFNNLLFQKLFIYLLIQHLQL